YKVLGVARDATPELVKSTYRKLSMKHHPDRAKDGEKEAATRKMAEINEANEILSDPFKRKTYDRTGKVQA
ncbi:heat shock protein DnaJ, partial [Glonium stellatum]